jgi:uncharacterized protein YdeI (YjbR/CyaY-like superfamily)
MVHEGAYSNAVTRQEQWEKPEKLNETLAEISVLQGECEVLTPSRRFAQFFMVPAVSELHRHR